MGCLRGLGLRVGVLGVAALLSLAMGGGELLAQGATVVATSETGGAAAHPARIARGTCATLSAKAEYQLSPVGFPEATGASGAPIAGTPLSGKGISGQVAGTPGAIPVFESLTDLQGVTIPDLLTSPHAIVVGATAANGQRTIACGNIGGTVVGGALLFGLQAENDSGYTGVALINSGEKSIHVEIYLVHPTGTTGAPAS